MTALVGLVALYVLFTVVWQGLSLVGLTGSRVLWSQVGLAAFLSFGLVELRRDRRKALRTFMLGCALVPAGGLAAWLTGRVTVPGPIFLSTLAVAVLALLGFAWCYRRRYEPGSYGDWLTNPGFREAVAAEFATVDRALEADRRDPPDPRAVVADLLEPGTSRFVTRRRLMALGPAALPAVCAAIADPRFAPRPGDDGESPFGVLLRLLPHPPPPEIGPGVARYVDVPDTELAEKCGDVWIETGDPQALDYVLARLGPDPEQAGRVYSALENAARAGRLPAAFRAPVGDRLVAILDAAPDFGPMRALVAVDPDRARAWVTAPAALRDLDLPRSRMMSAYLKGGGQLPADLAREVVERGRAEECFFMLFVVLPHAGFEADQLAELVASLRDVDDGHARRAVRWALDELVRRDAPQARALVESVAGWDDGELRGWAWGTLNLLDGLPRSPDVYGEYQRVGWEGLDPPQRLYYVLGFAAALTSNGGFEHAVESLDGEHVRTLRDNLERLPDPIRGAMQRGFDLLCPGGVPLDQQARVDCIAENYARVETQLEEVSRTLWNSDGLLEEFRAGLVRQHPGSFAHLTDEDAPGG